MIGKVRWGARIVLVGVIAAAALLQLGIYRQAEMFAPPFAHGGGYSYSRPFSPAICLPWLLHTPTSFEDRPWTSRLNLLEDGRALPRDDYHANIKDRGGGRFSHWGPVIYFSASDDSDPNRNGRSYTVEYPVLVRWDAVALGVVGLLVLEAFLLAWAARKRGEGLSPRNVLLALLSPRPMPEKVYWVLFALILGCGIAFRGFWTFVLEVPFAYPDTGSYYAPLVTHPYFPFSEARTGGVSMFIATALALFRAPIGLLLLANLLALACTVVLALAIKSVLHQKVLSLTALLLFLFIPKDVTFEYSLLSEHYSRCLYLAAAGCMLWIVQEPQRYWLSALLGLLATLNILVKPSALVLTVAVVLALGALAWLAAGARRTALARTTAVFLAVNLTLVLAYMAAFQQRFGTFNLTHFDGFNLYSHVGHLTVLDGGVHPELKSRLKPVLATYIEKYASKGRYEPNWLVYGATSPEIQNDLGKETPASIITEYVRQRYRSGEIRWINQVYKDLALEAMAAHPLGYLRYARDQALHLWSTGYSLTYYGGWPNLSEHRSGIAMQREWLYQFYGRTVLDCGSTEIVPADANVLTRNLFRGAFAACVGPRYDEPDNKRLVFIVAETFNGTLQSLSPAFEALPMVGLVGLAFGLIVLPWSRTGDIRNPFGFGLFLLLVLFGYSDFHGLVNVSEPVRMTTNVQDLAVLMFMVFIACALLQVRELTLRRLPPKTPLTQPAVPSEL
jgi:hypothetical protein